MEAEAVEPPREPTLLDRIRNTWEFANLSQWIFTFGKAVKIDETWSDIEVCPTPAKVHLHVGGFALPLTY